MATIVATRWSAIARLLQRTDYGLRRQHKWFRVGIRVRYVSSRDVWCLRSRHQDPSSKRGGTLTPRRRDVVVKAASYLHCMGFSWFFGTRAPMSSEVKQALKQLRKILREQREYEMFLRAESAHRLDTLVEKLLPFLPYLVSKFTEPSNTRQETSSSAAAQAAPHTTEAEPAAGPPSASVRHWFNPDSVIGCGLNIYDLSAEELTCLRGEVTCAGCLAQLRAEQEKGPARAKTDAAAGG